MNVFELTGSILLNDGGISNKLTAIDNKAKGTGGVFESAFGKIGSSAAKLAGILGL